MKVTSKWNGWEQQSGAWMFVSTEYVKFSAEGSDSNNYCTDAPKDFFVW